MEHLHFWLAKIIDFLHNCLISKPWWRVWFKQNTYIHPYDQDSTLPCFWVHVSPYKLDLNKISLAYLSILISKKSGNFNLNYLNHKKVRIYA